MTVRKLFFGFPTLLAFIAVTICDAWAGAGPPPPAPYAGQFTGEAPAPGQPLSLWYRQPAQNWRSAPVEGAAVINARAWEAEALPLGNGRIGAMLFGGVDLERVQFNEDSLWTGNSTARGLFQNFGQLQLLLGLGANATLPTVQNFRRELDLTTGIGSSEFTVNGVTYRRETFASHPDQVIALRWTASAPGMLSARIQLGGAHDETTKADGTTLSFSGTLPNGLQYEAQARVLTKGGKVAVDGSDLVLTGCDEAVILLDTGTNYIFDYSKNFQGENPHNRVVKQLDDAAKLGWEQLRSQHLKDFQNLFNRVTAAWGQSTPPVLALPTDARLEAYRAGGKDPQLEQILFQMGRYLLISSSRRPGLPANLQGLWNDSNNPSWGSDYHTNINIQMNYWLAEPANLSECALPLFDMIMALREPSRVLTRQQYGEVRGWTMRTEMGPFGGQSYTWNIPASAWLSQHFWEHYAFTQDKAFLRDTAYPMLKEVCNYWEDRLKKLPDGTLVAPMGWSPEHGPTEDGVTHDQQIIWELFNNYVQAATILNVDADYRVKIADMRDHLRGTKIGSWGQVLEWMTEKQDAILDTPNDHHRHTSQLFALHPGQQINLTETPDLAKAAKVSLEARGNVGDSRRQWAWVWRCAMWARLHEPEKAYEMIRGLFTYNLLPNLFGWHGPMQLDGDFGYTAAVCELLLQSQAGEIELLPAIPKEWPEGSFKGLRARGGFEVDAAWKDGKLVTATIRSAPGTSAKLRYAGKVVNFELKPGESKTVGPEL